MKKSNILLPTTRSLCALEATVRLGTATQAADELHVTQTAISHRLRDLEDRLGQPLFSRNGRRLKPNAAALQLAEAVRTSSEILENVWVGLRNKAATDQFTISMLPALASKWLAPLMSEMSEEIQTANLRISATRELVNFQDDGITAAIRYGTGNWPLVRARHLASETVAPVMSPDMAQHLDVLSNDALCDVKLLRSDNPDSWEDWFAASGLRQPSSSYEVFFDEDATMIEAAITGHGVALGRFALVAHDLRSGRLVAPIQCRLTSSYSYWFVQGQNSCQAKPILDFFNWSRNHLMRDSQLPDLMAKSYAD